MPDGICSIKPEYIVQKLPAPQTSGDARIDDKLEDNSSYAKKIKLSAAESTDTDKKDSNKKTRGQNTARPKPFREEKQLLPCPTIINLTPGEAAKPCSHSNCKFIHDPVEYLKNKPKDLGPACHVFRLKGLCARGLACRFGSEHITEDGRNVIDGTRHKQWVDDTLNILDFETQVKLQRKRYNFEYAEQTVRDNDDRRKNKDKNSNSTSECTNKDSVKKSDDDNNDDSLQSETKVSEEIAISSDKTKTLGCITDEDVIKINCREKKTIDWSDKLYLSPLTTVGNLPFRRICKEYGADITCGEMALCDSLLKGFKQEWALIKRHASEDLFGVQICSNNAYAISKVCQLIKDEMKVDFVDLNLGCPIDLVYKNGAGCGMLHRMGALETSIKCAAKILPVPFTIKTRTGVYQDKRIAHNLVPKFAHWGASLVTVHGRSREQRYTRLSDWEYIEQCAKAADPCPVYGNGDILCYDDYVRCRATAPTVKGVLIGRGALVKPWLFTEIKEQKLWDISSSERFDILKKYTNYGLEHWGSDNQGVENTRRFLLEWLSFLYRYIPVGLLEKPPQKINERPPVYHGRDDLETLMASGNCSDWVQISEMLLGPVPSNYNFLPKHKASSYK